VSLFVTFEGPDGSGKSTQIQRVSERLKRENYEVVVTREPGGTTIGERIRDVLLTQGECAIVPRAEALLMSAARVQHVSEVVLPSLRRGAIVLCDRFVDSTLAYQGAGRGISIGELRELQRFTVDDLSPDLTILLDIDAETGIERKFNSGDPLNRLDQDSVTFHQRVRAWYVQAAEHEPERWVKIDARRNPAAITDEIVMRIIERIASRHEHDAGDRKSG
jgi:dTMP kinase